MSGCVSCCGYFSFFLDPRKLNTKHGFGSNTKCHSLEGNENYRLIRELSFLVGLLVLLIRENSWNEIVRDNLYRLQNRVCICLIENG